MELMTPGSAIRLATNQAKGPDVHTEVEYGIPIPTPAFVEHFFCVAY